MNRVMRPKSKSRTLRWGWGEPGGVEGQMVGTGERGQGLGTGE